MSYAKIATTIEPELLSDIDSLVLKSRFNSRSHFFRVAAFEKLNNLKEDDLAYACKFIDPGEEKQLAELGINEDLESWPKF